MARNFSSPQLSPREDLDINGSTYALQVALRNMKERYHKLQRKLSFIEEENQRLQHGKTELFGEIGVMQKSSIKLREKNLQLNQEIHSKQQENCSLRESYSSVSRQNITLARDNRRLKAQVLKMLSENKVLQQQRKGGDMADDEIETGVEAELELLEQQQQNRLSPDSITAAVVGNDSDNSMDSIDATTPRHNTHTSPPHTYCGEAPSPYGDLFDASEDASDRMDGIMDEIQRQNLALRALLPILNGKSSSSTLQSQRDRDLSTVTVAAVNRTMHQQEDGVHYDSRLATCGSVAVGDFRQHATAALNNTHSSDAGTAITSHPAATSHRSSSPFDWKKVQVSDEDSGSDNDSEASSILLPQTAIDATASDPVPSPHQQQPLQRQPQQPSTPMSHQQQAYEVTSGVCIQPYCDCCTGTPPQQPGLYATPQHPYHNYANHQQFVAPKQHQSSRSRSNSVGNRNTSRGLLSSPSTGNVNYNQLYPAGALDDDSKICPMCNQVFSKEFTQDMFENHVVAHFEDVDIGFEVV